MIEFEDVTDHIDTLVAVGDREATIPGAAILGFTRVADGGELHRIGPAMLLAWNGALVPVIDLPASLGLAPCDAESGILVVVSQPAPDGPKALLVDAVREQGDALAWRDAPVPALLASYLGQPLSQAAAEAADDDRGHDLFLTVVAGGLTYLLPLGDIVRIEPFPEGGLQPCGTGLATVVSGRLLRTVPLFGCIPGDRQAQALVVTVSASGQVAFVVDALGDVVEPPAVPRLPWGRDGIVEARVVEGSAIGVVDIAAAMAEPAALRRAA